MGVEVCGTARARGIRRAAIRRKARAILEAVGRADAELSIRLVGDDEMRRLNGRWRGREGPTDVLAFPLEEGEFGSLGTGLGDVVISLETARRQAEERGRPLEEEVERLLVHGILHLVGYDHERSPGEARRMQRKERAVRLRLREAIRERPQRRVRARPAG